jgi:hypothetical protein
LTSWCAGVWLTQWISSNSSKRGKVEAQRGERQTPLECELPRFRVVEIIHSSPLPRRSLTVVVPLKRLVGKKSSKASSALVVSLEVLYVFARTLLSGRSKAAVLGRCGRVRVKRKIRLLPTIALSFQLLAASIRTNLGPPLATLKSTSLSRREASSPLDNLPLLSQFSSALVPPASTATVRALPYCHD